MPSVVYKSPSNLRCLAQHSEPAPLLCISDSPPSAGLVTLPSPPRQTDRETNYLSVTASSSVHLHHRPTPGAWLSTVSLHHHHELHSAASPPCHALPVAVLSAPTCKSRTSSDASSASAICHNRFALPWRRPGMPTWFTM